MKLKRPCTIHNYRNGKNSGTIESNEGDNSYSSQRQQYGKKRLVGWFLNSVMEEYLSTNVFRASSLFSTPFFE